MNEKVLNTLEYNKIIGQLTEFADSEPGKQVCMSLVPGTDLEEIRTAQAETRSRGKRIWPPPIRSWLHNGTARKTEG